MPLILAQWDPPLVVAVALLVAITLIMIVAIIRYNIDGVIKVWGLLGALVGLATGYFGSYFFTRPAVERAESEAKSARTVAAAAQNSSTQIAAQASEIARLVEKTGIERLATLPAERTAQMLSSANLHNSATQPVVWKEDIEKLGAQIRDIKLGAEHLQSVTHK